MKNYKKQTHKKSRVKVMKININLNFLSNEICINGKNKTKKRAR